MKKARLKGPLINPRDSPGGGNKADSLPAQLSVP